MIPLELIINWDQTCCKLIPGSDWTMETQGSKQVPVVGKDDKRGSFSASGMVLPSQVIYKEKTKAQGK